MERRPPSLTLRLVWRLQALAYDAFAGLFRLLPIDAASALGGVILGFVGPFLPEQRIADMNLQLAFPQWDAKRRREVIAAHWNNLGRTGVEYILMDRIVAEDDRIELIGGETTLAMSQAGDAMIIMSGHFANWETMLIAGLRLGLPLRASYRPANNPLIDQRVTALRRAYGLKMLAAKGASGSRGLIVTLKEGGAVAMLNDQRDDNGVFAPLFGVPAFTAQGPVRFALRNQARLIPVGVVRTKGARFRVTVYPEIPLDRDDEEQAALKTGVERVNAFMEARVRDQPGQWLWSHRRFPWEAYERLGYRRKKR